MATTNRPVIKQFGLQSDGDGRTLFATWSWDKEHTEDYQVMWQYATGVGVWFVGDDSNVEYKQSIYSAPENATQVKFTVKANSKTKKVNNKETKYWTSGWATTKVYSFKPVPATPPVPTVTIDKFMLKAELDGLESDTVNTGYHVYFEVVKDNKKLFKKTGKVAVRTRHAQYTCPVNAGSVYKVRCRASIEDRYSEYSEFSANVGTIPNPPTNITECRAESPTSVKLAWTEVASAETYDIEYTTERRFFDSSDQTTTLTGIEEAHYIKTGLETGHEYFFRVRAVNEQGESGWSKIASTKVGTTPAAPTTWSSTTTATVGEPLILYWMHNSEDESDQTVAEIKLIADNDETTVYRLYNGTCTTEPDVATKIVSTTVQDWAEVGSGTFPKQGWSVKIKMDNENIVETPSLNVNGTGAISVKTSGTNSVLWEADSIVIFQYDGTNWVIIEDDAKENVSSYTIQTSSYPEGTNIKWSVRTAGVTTDFGDWAVLRSVDIYAPVTISLDVTNSEGESLVALESFPFYINATAGPNTQTPIGWYITISPNTTYETVDQIGNQKIVNAGEIIYSRYVDSSASPLLVEMSANNLDLENNIQYTVICKVTMNSGLTATAISDFIVLWTDEEFPPNAEMAYDEETLTMSVRPYCVDAEENLIDGVTLSVYRREYDGSFTELGKDIANDANVYVTDPHPSLDYARYRIVSKTESTGSVSYYDAPGYPVGEKSVVIQWDEAWSNFDTTNSDAITDPTWSGSMLKLPYNIDVSSNYSPDVSLIEYIGRQHPVSYYGTQLGETASWSVAIDKSDTETLYALRRLARWMGDVYVREPSGSGYWANITVSFSQTHLELTIPVTLDITRVEGGM